MESHPGWIVCGEAANGLEAVERAAALKPDVILLDITMPELDGLTAVPLIRQRAPETQIIILTLHESLDMARTAAFKGSDDLHYKISYNRRVGASNRILTL